MERPDNLDRGEPARLIPVTADSNREARAASIFLATLMAVPPFAREVLGTLGQRVGTRSSVQCFTEIRYKNEETTNLRPDGLLILESGRGRNWCALIEAKIGNGELTSEQVESYLQIAKRNDASALITISNQFVARPTHSPVKISKVALRGVELFHFSWIYIKTAAHLLLVNGKFDSPEQKYVLSEFYRFLDHHSVGVSRFDRMNSEWKELVSKVNAKATLSKTSKEVENTVAAWQQEVRDICLLMTQNVNRPVDLKLNRIHANDPIQRLKDESEHLAQNCELSCTLNIPDAASPLEVRANLRERSICVSMSLVAPKDKQRATSRINWLLRQIPKKDGPNDVYIKCNWPGRTLPTQASLVEARAKPETLSSANGSAAPISFEVLLIRDIAGRFSGTKTFIEHLEAAVPDFYSRVGEHLRAYVAPAPKLQGQKESEEEAAAEEVQEEGGLPIVGATS